MCLRAESRAAATAADNEQCSRTLASLSSTRRLMPPSTAMLVLRAAMARARLLAVPPSMSVSTITPSPLSTRAIASLRRWRFRSSGPSESMTSASSCGCGRPSTRSLAATNSRASPPSETITNPIIATTTPHHDPQSARPPRVGAGYATPSLECASPTVLSIESIERGRNYERNSRLAKLAARRERTSDRGEGERGGAPRRSFCNRRPGYAAAIASAARNAIVALISPPT